MLFLVIYERNTIYFLRVDSFGVIQFLPPGICTVGAAGGGIATLL